MKAIESNEQTFRTSTTAPGIVLVDFWAAWCGPCRTFKPVFEAAAARHPDVRFLKVDVDANPAIANEWGIRSIPTVMAFRDGVPLFREPGILPAAAIDELISELKRLDMVAIRKEVDARAAARAAAR